MKNSAIVLFSGGLDSILTYKIVEGWGFDVVALNFLSPFVKRLNAEYYLKNYNIEFREYEFLTDQYEVLKNPVYGYGKAINPCIDCHAAMIRKAKGIMIRERALFIATGEVVGQRPMSQRRDAMNSVEKLSNCEGCLVRPLSGKNLPPTYPEKKGVIKREWMYDINGRGRKKQYELCRVYGIEKIPSSGGGCLLTEKSFVGRVKTALKYDNKEILEFAKKGRMFDLDGAVLILARDREESEYLEINGGERIMEPINKIGPTGILFGEGKLVEACEIIGSYSKGEGKTIKCQHRGLTIEAEVPDEKNSHNLVF